jgi:hypothetical protein
MTHGPTARRDQVSTQGWRLRHRRLPAAAASGLRLRGHRRDGGQAAAVLAALAGTDGRAAAQFPLPNRPVRGADLELLDGGGMHSERDTDRVADALEALFAGSARWALSRGLVPA